MNVCLTVCLSILWFVPSKTQINPGGNPDQTRREYLPGRMVTASSIECIQQGWEMDNKISIEEGAA